MCKKKWTNAKMQQHTKESEIFHFSCLSHSKILHVNLSFDSSFFIRVFLHVPLFLISEGALHPTKGTTFFVSFPEPSLHFHSVTPTCTFFLKSPQNQTFLPFFSTYFVAPGFSFFLPIELKFDPFFVLCSIEQNPICLLLSNLKILSSKLLIL